MRTMDDIIEDLDKEADDLLVQQAITTEENITSEEIIKPWKSIFPRDINTFKPSFNEYITDLAKTNGCLIIVKDSKTDFQLCKFSETSKKYSTNCPSYIFLKGKGTVISFERSFWYNNHS